MKQTYKTNHPKIKEITIGDKFVTENEKIVEFVKYDDLLVFPFIMELSDEKKVAYNMNLKFFNHINNANPLDIKQKYISLKDKINLL